MYSRGEVVDRFGGKCSEWSSAGLILLKFSNGSESSSYEGAGLYVVQRLIIPIFSFFFGTSTSSFSPHSNFAHRVYILLSE